jgi:hypothetical protein
MKRILAVALLLMSFASVALADGPGMPPDCNIVNWKWVCPGPRAALTDESQQQTKPPTPGVVRLADGGGLPPTTTKPPKPVAPPLADGGGLPPIKTTTNPPQA